MVFEGAAVFSNANPLVLLASVLFAAGAPNAKVEDEDEAVLAVVVLAGTAAPEAAPLPKVNMPPELGAAAVVSFLAPPPKNEPTNRPLHTPMHKQQRFVVPRTLLL